MVALQGVPWVGPVCVGFGAGGRCKRGLQLLLSPQAPLLVASALSRLRIQAFLNRVSPTCVLGPARGSLPALCRAVCSSEF